MGIGYVGVGGVAKQVADIYVGVGGVAKTVSTAYIGDSSGIARVAYSKGNSKPWLCFTAVEANCGIVLTYNQGLSTPTDVFEYSYNGRQWHQLTVSVTTMVLANIGDKVYIRALGVNAMSGCEIAKHFQFTITAKARASGNIMSLMHRDCETTETTKNCFMYLFNGCVNLLSMPDLTATSLAEGCYQHMFHGCTNLIETTNLNATYIGKSSYEAMFLECTSLVNPPQINASGIGISGCDSMFSGCSSLASAPALPALTLEQRAYYFMFSDCTSLAHLNTVGARNVGVEACSYMFHGCTSLQDAFPLSGIESVDTSSFAGTYQECTSLNKLPKIEFTNIPIGCFKFMFSECSNIKLSETATGSYTTPYKIPYSSTSVAVGSSALYGMFRNTGGTFTDTPIEDTTYYTSNALV